MKKRVLAILLTALMVISLVPVQVFATEDPEPHEHDGIVFQPWTS